MMLMLSELRRHSRSSARDASVGTLLLDNPLGNANAGFLIEVQRTVAAAAGIQLIYTTGIADGSRASSRCPTTPPEGRCGETYAPTPRSSSWSHLRTERVGASPRGA
jgi:hypothetical protein